MYCKIFIFVHKNLFAQQEWNLLEKITNISLYNYQH